MEMESVACEDEQLNSNCTDIDNNSDDTTKKMIAADDDDDDDDDNDDDVIIVDNDAARQDMASSAAPLDDVVVPTTSKHVAFEVKGSLPRNRVTFTFPIGSNAETNLDATDNNDLQSFGRHPHSLHKTMSSPGMLSRTGTGRMRHPKTPEEAAVRETIVDRPVGNSSTDGNGETSNVQTGNESITPSLQEDSSRDSPDIILDTPETVMTATEDSTRRQDYGSDERKPRLSYSFDDLNRSVEDMMSEIAGIPDKPSYADADGHGTSTSPISTVPLFVQLNEFHRDDMGGLSNKACWKPAARWIKFEEDWEEGGNRWSKPHVASLTFNSLPQLRKLLENGLVLLDTAETSLHNIFNQVVDDLERMEMIDADLSGTILRMLHICTARKPPEKRGLGSIRRSVRGTMRRFSVRGGADKAGRRHNSEPSVVMPRSSMFARRKRSRERSQPNLKTDLIEIAELPESPTALPSDEVHVLLPPQTSDNVNQNNNNATDPQLHPSSSSAPSPPPRDGILRKLPENTEGAVTMTAIEDAMKRPITVLIRFLDPQIHDNLSVLEGPLPLKFMFFLVGPAYNNVNYHQIGRAMSTLFSDDTFRNIAYSVSDKHDLVNGINEFLNGTTVLPPGEWDKDLLSPITKHHDHPIHHDQKTLSVPDQPEQEKRKNADVPDKNEEAYYFLPKNAEHLDLANPLQRTGQVFGGLINDVRRRYRHYQSDITDGANLQCIATFVIVYFACLSPAITFGAMLGEKTKNLMGVTEMIVSTSLCGMLFAVFAGQPLVILGGTGPVLIFEVYLYEFCKQSDIEFMAFRTWISFWICLLATLMVAVEGSVLVRYFTRFTEEIFSTLISLIFIVKVYSGLEHIMCANPILPDYCLEHYGLHTTQSTENSSAYWTNFSTTTEGGLYIDPHAASASDPSHHPAADISNCNDTKSDNGHENTHHDCTPNDEPYPNTALFAIILTMGTFLIAFYLRYLRTSKFLGRKARMVLGNFGIVIAIGTMVTLAYLVKDIYTDTIVIHDGFHPTNPCRKGWFISPFGEHQTLPLGYMGGAIIPALLVFILLYMETLLIGMNVNKDSNKLRKGSGYHLDLFLIGVLAAIAGLMGVPWMCAAPIRTVSHVGSLTVLTGSLAPGVKPKLDHIKDQRVTNFVVSLLIGLSALMAPLMREIPIAVLLGVFLYLGVTSLSGIQLIARLKLLLIPQKYHADVMYVRMVKAWKMHTFTIMQVACLVSLWLIKNSILAIMFPFFLIMLTFIRVLLKFCFSQPELDALDCHEDDQEDDNREIFDIDDRL